MQLLKMVDGVGAGSGDGVGAGGADGVGAWGGAGNGGTQPKAGGLRSKLAVTQAAEEEAQREAQREAVLREAVQREAMQREAMLREEAQREAVLSEEAAHKQEEAARQEAALADAEAAAHKVGFRLLPQLHLERHRWGRRLCAMLQAAGGSGAGSVAKLAKVGKAFKDSDGLSHPANLRGHRGTFFGT
jgi:delta 1-pyrroline-5-carboxylate dehydrogenase